MISAAFSSEINASKNSNETFIEIREPISSENTKNFQIWYERCRTELIFKNPFMWNYIKNSHYHLRKFPFFIFFISALEVLVFYGAEDKLKRILMYDTKNKKQIWRFITYMLLHTDSVHLGINILIQGLLGTVIEFEQGQLRCAAIYFGGGLAGSVGAYVFSAFTLMVGASGGVYALLISQIPNVVLNFKTVKYASFRIIIVVVLTASDVLYIFIHVRFFNNEGPQIGWVAHAWGAAAGLLLGFLLFDGTSKLKWKFQVASCLIFAFFFLFVIIFSLATSAFGLGLNI